jgi:lipoate-protein ligase A
MSCRYFIDPPATGARNMAVDEVLLESAALAGQFSLRFYSWQASTLSLGYFQQYADRQQHSASQNCPAVRRPTGGGAILHDREITYSVAVPPGHRLAAKHLLLYEAVHDALIDVLAGCGIHATLYRASEGAQRVGGPILADHRDHASHGAPAVPEKLGQSPAPFLCFQRRAPGDVLVGDIKIAGSAQRRWRGAVLQHGSLLLARSPAAPELPGLQDIAPALPRIDQLAPSWSARLAAAVSLELHAGELAIAEQRRIVELTLEKYDTIQWTQCRRPRNMRKTSMQAVPVPPL